MDLMEKLLPFEKKGGDLLQRQGHLLKRLSEGSQTQNQSIFEELSENIDEIQCDILPFLEGEEKNIYSFLEKRIPKLQPAIHFLISEHDEFREKIKELDQNFHELVESKNLANFTTSRENLQNLCQYLTHLFRNHIRAEKKMLLQVAENTLNEEEKSELGNLLRSF